MLNFQRLEMFVNVAAAGSFTAAAATMGLTKAVVSFNIKQLEAELGVALLHRTTRRVSLTGAGEGFYQRCLLLLQDAESVLDEVRLDHQGLSGTLRLTTTPEYGARVVVPALTSFSERHPQLRIQQVSSSQHNDLISGRFDVAIRLGQLADSSHHATLIDSFAILPVASPAYLQRYAPQGLNTLEQLAQAKWLAHSRLSTPLSWVVTTPQKVSCLFSVEPDACVTADSAAALLSFALHGAGIALLPQWLVAEHVAKQKLTVLLPDHQFPRQGVYALYPNTRYVPEKVRLFIEHLRASVGEVNEV
ncbi:LysR family transcriptional regulator [Rouxiella badensis]|uniref:LysR family transcriptional regulator n=1 Tax=Rouxiella badensis TaxID=1646377 RepID=A0A1X0WJ38_9GAMM|nr:LysR family transcriptional regulator [Rouxiella badensis]MCC3717268.1 LysR family transcriptional regulator [Rouxiella badensis]MCC3728364.1 LysR family transcriptional regulator [Rouxiella badensis]MCC3732268.1 LysR family transcriptional regulator [Rouxiella badensis]MCC3740108.1 LysR family transcriptional regulator [Rouxiella badensis]MCC3759149.1 LysR family transcriptional regulator [Rouxiella badensis]